MAAKSMHLRSLISSVATVSFCLPVSLLGAQAQPSPSAERPVTVTDAIRMSRLADPDYFHGGDSKGHVVQFSPDGERFVVVVRRGNMEQNTNEYSLLLYRTTDALQSPKPEILLKMCSSSNRDAIGKVRWLGDNQTLVFLAENPNEAAQIYALNISTKRLTRLTNHPSSITNYDIATDGQDILFLADTPAKAIKDTEVARRDGIVITDQLLSSLLVGNCASSMYCVEQQFFLQRGQESPVAIPVHDLAWSDSPLSLSPDGQHAIVGVNILSEELPRAWGDYRFIQNEYMHGFFKDIRGSSPFGRYLLVDTKKGSAEPLWDAPMIQFPPLTFAADSQSLFLRSYLPLEGTYGAERKAREENQYAVEVRVSSREFRKVKEDEFSKEGNKSVPVDVTLEENINTPPKIYASDPKSQKKTLLLDLNPQFSDRKLGKVEIFEWKTVEGVEVMGGLYLPTDYTPGRRYPLVIQTHGFDPARFSMDGLNEWSSGYAARPLAAKGVVVLQAYKFKNTNDSDRIGNDGHLGANPSQAHKKFAVTAYEGAIDSLDKRGLIDRGRVGLMGFSRTVCFAATALTHSKYHFAAAILVDGIGCGYFEYIAFGGHPDEDDLNGGVPPFGENLTAWLREAPGFNLEKVHTPLRLEAHGASAGVLELWEWFSGLSRLAKPVEYLYLPDAEHMLVKPWERRTSQQGAVDWFCFWLKGVEDTEPAKADQYTRWRKLRRLQDENGRVP
jgi:dipeptidyl aminopeptidase/acylaminoacyl peptidase